VDDSGCVREASTVGILGAHDEAIDLLESALQACFEVPISGNTKVRGFLGRRLARYALDTQLVDDKVVVDAELILLGVIGLTPCGDIAADSGDAYHCRIAEK
jgi:hypothetical protein